MCVFVFAALPIVYKKIHIIKCGWVGQLTIIQIDNYENAYDNHINVHRLQNRDLLEHATLTERIDATYKVL